MSPPSGDKPEPKPNPTHHTRSAGTHARCYRREKLLAAIRSRDPQALKECGWLPFAQYMRHASVSKFDWDHLEAFALTFGDRHPEEVLEAAIASVKAGVARGYRPTVTQLAQFMASSGGHRDETEARPDLKPEALAAVHRLVIGGARVCECFPPTMTLRMSAAGVLRCFDCGGLEPGQVDQAVAATNATAAYHGRGSTNKPGARPRAGVCPQAETGRYPGGSKAAVAHD